MGAIAIHLDYWELLTAGGRGDRPPTSMRCWEIVLLEKQRYSIEIKNHACFFRKRGDHAPKI